MEAFITPAVMIDRSAYEYLPRPFIAFDPTCSITSRIYMETEQRHCMMKDTAFVADMQAGALGCQKRRVSREAFLQLLTSCPLPTELLKISTGWSVLS